ncbi:hypothetical protein ACFL6M_04575 [Candidatus Eisenbacteria bacterium]|uniref:FlgD Ig-like domain-containing protein n=1 Tax=Eiseniibacteriota bacterium TaxID=2212470 RepID=A0ABV6YKJ6_UNCEI
MTRLESTLLGLFLAIVAFCSPAIADVISTFNDGWDGWTPTAVEGTSWEPVGGNPAGYIRFDDHIGGSGWIIAPPEFLGDWSQLNDTGAISYDHRLFQSGHIGTPGWLPYEIRITGSEGEAVWTSPPPTSATGWRRLVAPLVSSEWNVTGSWHQLLTNVVDLRIRLEIVDNDGYEDRDIEGVDNVILGEPLGACCRNNGMTCEVLSEDACVAAGGDYAGHGTECSEIIPVHVNEGSIVVTHYVEVPIVCGNPSRDRGFSEPCPPGGPYFDAWTTSPDEVMCHNFGVEGSPAIPADVFEPGSEPFEGAVCLQGVPLGHPDYGDADTIIERSEDPFDRCELPSPDSVTVEIWVIDLSLESTEPITVITSGEPILWDVSVDLSEVAAPAGWLTAMKTHCNGGSYTTVLHVQPRFTFTKVADPAEIRVLDTGLVGSPWITLEQPHLLEWVSDVGIMGGAIDRCSDFHAGFGATDSESLCDCNGNGLRDICDIEGGLCEDCNGNSIPDSCDVASGGSTDTDENGIPDECDPGACCPPESVCVMAVQSECTGEWLGPGTFCDPDPCPTSDAQDQHVFADRITLSPPVPNPTTGLITYRVGLPHAARISVGVFDVAGRLVEISVDRMLPAGRHRFTWNPVDGKGRKLPGGIYYLRLDAGGVKQTQKFMLTD